MWHAAVLKADHSKRSNTTEKKRRDRNISRKEKRVKREIDQRHHFLFGLTLSGPFCSLCKGQILAWDSGWRHLWHMQCPLKCPGRDLDHLTVKKKKEEKSGSERVCRKQLLNVFNILDLFQYVYVEVTYFETRQML